MDVKVIEQKQFAERYLFGRLTPPEAKFFEQLVRKSPELAERMGLPGALQRTMRLLDETGTEWRESAPKLWHKPWVAGGLAVATAVLLVLSLTLALGKHALAARYETLRGEADRGLLLAPTRSQTLRLTPARPGDEPQTFVLGTRASPTLAELRFDLGYVKANLYRVIIRRDDGTYWGRFDNQLRDSNGELRFGFNSGAFAVGHYDVEIDAVNLRGDGDPVGRLRLRVDPR
jgi:hypothetical protein